MLSAVAQKIISHIDGYMARSGLMNSRWYVGIANDAEKRLFTDHCVDKDNGLWAWGLATNHLEARHIEALYHKAGCKGGPGGGDETTVFVYAYLITQSTAE